MSMSMAMSGTPTAAAAATKSAMSQSGMDMGGGNGDGPTCKISMLWNWFTVDACRYSPYDDLDPSSSDTGFLAESWHVSSNGVFAVSCIGVVLLVVCLEVLRRVGKEYDRFLVAQFQRQSTRRISESSSEGMPCTTMPTYQNFRYTPLQQLARSVIHMATFAVAYFIMLLAMYFNGYIIISIFIGALIGKFICDWETVKIPTGSGSNSQVERERQVPKGEQELTYCCG